MGKSSDFKRLREHVGDEFADAVEKLYSLYTDDIIDWIVELYDPGTGGFYASIPGRDGISFGPDIQSTMQLLYFIVRSGLSRKVGDDYTKILPEDMRHRLIYFAKSLQDPENGYFYHKQWGRAGTDSKLSRRGRDIGWACQLLSALGSAPTYTAANGTPGDGITADEYWDSLGTEAQRPYTYDQSPVEYIEADGELVLKCKNEEEAFKIKLERAIAGAPKAASSNGDTTAYLKSHKGFIRYLLERVEPYMHSNPYMMGNEINSSGGIIRKYSQELGPYKYEDGDGEECKQFDGMTNTEMFVTVLLRSINPETGIWGDLTPEAPKGCEFRYINGFFKTVHGLISNGVPYPREYVAKAAGQIMACLMGDEPSTTNVCEIFNIWSTVTFLKESLKLEKDESIRDAVLAEINGILEKSAPAAIINTYEKLKGYKKIEGGLAHNYYKGTDCHQSLPVSTGENVSDVDGTCCGSTGAVRRMFDTLGIAEYMPAFFDEDKWDYFYKKISEKQPIKKKVYIPRKG